MKLGKNVKVVKKEVSGGYVFDLTLETSTSKMTRTVFVSANVEDEDKNLLEQLLILNSDYLDLDEIAEDVAEPSVKDINFSSEFKKVEVLFIKGNGKYNEKLNNELTNTVIDLVKTKHSKLTVIDSDRLEVPKIQADIYIGFSRGTRYFKKLKQLYPNAKFISIGGIGCLGCINIKNNNDNLKYGENFTINDLLPHFSLTDRMKQLLLNSI